MDGAEVVSDHRGGGDRAVHRLVDHRGAGIDDGGGAQPHLGCLCRPFRRPGRRFRHPVQRPLPPGALQGARSPQGPDGGGGPGRSSADARRRRGRRRLPVLPADRLSRGVGARPDRRHGHGHRLHHQHHGAAGDALRASPARRAGGARYSRPRSGRRFPGTLPHPDHRRDAGRRDRRAAAPLFPAVRFQPDKSAQRHRRIGCDLSRPAARSRHRGEFDQRAGALGGGGRRGRPPVQGVTAGRHGQDVRHLRPRRSAGQAWPDRRGGQGSRSGVGAAGARRADRRGNRRGVETSCRRPDAGVRERQRSRRRGVEAARLPR